MFSVQGSGCGIHGIEAQAWATGHLGFDHGFRFSFSSMVSGLGFSVGFGIRVGCLGVLKNSVFGCYLTANVCKVIHKKSIPAKNRQLIRYMSNDKGYVDGFMQELTFAERLI